MNSQTDGSLGFIENSNKQDGDITTIDEQDKVATFPFMMEPLTAKGVLNPCVLGRSDASMLSREP